MRLLFDTNAFDEEVRLEVKKFQGKSAADKKMIKGTPSEGTCNTLSNTKLMTRSWKRGLRITHA